MRQQTDEILHSISAIDRQSAAIQAARANRQLAQRRLAEGFGEPDQSTLGHLIPSMPEPYRPLATALVQENNELLARVRQRAQQSHVLLRQSLEMMQRFITTLPSHDTAILSHREQGSVVAVEPGSPLYEAIV